MTSLKPVTISFSGCLAITDNRQYLKNRFQALPCEVQSPLGGELLCAPKQLTHYHSPDKLSWNEWRLSDREDERIDLENATNPALRAYLDQVPLNYPSETVVQPSSTPHLHYGFPTVEPLSWDSNKLLSSNPKTAIFQPCKRCHTP